MRVASLHLYPVKSLRGISVTEAFLETAGLRHDRRLMLVDDQGLFQTQRRLGRMARLAPTLLEGDRLAIENPDGERIEIDLLQEGEIVAVEIWNDRIEAERAWTETDAWFTRELGYSVRLVRMIPERPRPANPTFVRDGDHMSLADGYPVLLAGDGSLADLNARLAEPIPMDRFRPNLVAEGMPAWEEEVRAGWTVGETELRFTKPCVRCKVTTLDQATGEPTGPEPLRMLATYRRSGNGVAFGANLVPVTLGTIRVGDPIRPVD